jgi:hypothetical protein
MKLEMQFQHHKKQFLDLHAELHRVQYSLQLEAVLENFQSLLLES